MKKIAIAILLILSTALIARGDGGDRPLEFSAKVSKVNVEGIFHANHGLLIVEKQQSPPALVVFQQRTNQPATFFRIPVQKDELKREVFDSWPADRWLYRIVDSDRYEALPKTGKRKVRGRVFELKRVKQAYVDFKRKGTEGPLESKCPQIMQIDSAKSAHVSNGFHKYYIKTLDDTFVGNEASFEFGDRVFRNIGTQPFTMANGAAVVKPVLVEVDPRDD